MESSGEAQNRQNTCAELVHSALSKRSTLLERLVAVASLNVPSTGSYTDETLALKFGREEVDRVLRDEHLAVFEAWLCLDLQQQVEEIAFYCGPHQGSVVREWIQEKFHERLVPTSAMPVQRELFLTDLQGISALL